MSAYVVRRTRECTSPQWIVRMIAVFYKQILSAITKRPTNERRSAIRYLEFTPIRCAVSAFSVSLVVFSGGFNYRRLILLTYFFMYFHLRR